MERTQVVVVGGGPVGLLLACELRLGGAEVVVLEALAEPSAESRASTLHARTMEILSSRGLPLGSPPNDSRGHFGGIPIDLTLPSTHSGVWKVPQARLARVLEERARELGADIRRRHEVDGLVVADRHVEVKAGRARLRADYVVGCDGEQSMVRRLVGLELVGTGPTRELLRADVVGIEITGRRFQRLERGLAVSGRDSHGVTRVMVHVLGAKPVPRHVPPEFDELVQAWRLVTGEDISAGKPLWVNAFDDRSEQLPAYRRGRVLFAGDAAHRQLPVGGQALNLGLQDAANLGWKLAAEVTGRAPDGLLDSYHTELHAVGRRTLANISAQAQILLGGPEVEPMRSVLTELIGYGTVQQHLAGMISGLDAGYPSGADAHPLVGKRLPPTCGVQPPADGRGLLLGGSAVAYEDRVLVQGIAGGPPLLVRPDGHVAWVAGDPDPLSVALHRWFGVPSC